MTGIRRQRYDAEELLVAETFSREECHISYLAAYIKVWDQDIMILCWCSLSHVPLDVLSLICS